MFQDSLLSNGDPAQRRRARTASFLLESAIVAVAITVPLLQGVALPKVNATFLLTAPPPPRGGVPRVAEEPHGARTAVVVTDETAIRAPSQIPKHTILSADGPDVAPPIGVLGGDPNGSDRGVIGSVIGETESRTPEPPKRPDTPATPRRVIISVLDSGYLERQVQPVYPAIARAARVEGDVVLSAIIGRDGAVQQLHLQSGHPMLTQAALDAVRQWRYRPYRLNNEPVEVETIVTVRFRLGG